MTALERALVVYAEAKGHEVEYLHKDNIQWNIKDTAGFNFEHFKYRIMNKKDYRKVHDELSDFFKPLHTPEKKRTWNIEDLKKHKPAGFSCKTVTLTREEIEEMNKPKEASPEYKERYEKVAPFIKILQMWADGNEIESQSKIGADREWRKLPDNPGWNFNYSNYRLAGKPFTSPATEEDLKYMENYEWFKEVGSELKFYLDKTSLPKNGFYQIFDPVSRTWQDWSEK